MPKLEIQPFGDEHLDAAAEVLTARHARHRATEPLLPGNVDFRAEIAALWQKDRTSGAVALSEGRVTGYLLGVRRDDATWGPNVWIELAGHAAETAEDVRDLYAFAADHWVEEGRTRHYALVPASDDTLVDAWFPLSFGAQHAHGVRDVPPHTDIEVPDGFEIRAPTTNDIEALIEVDLALPTHQRRSPVFSSRPFPTREQSREEWVTTLVGGEEEILVGYLHGRPVACWALVPLDRSNEHSGLGRSDNACFLGFAATLPEARGSGIGLALTDASLARAAEQGRAAMVTDWRETNLLASRFWPRRGFRRTFLRLYRSIP